MSVRAVGVLLALAVALPAGAQALGLAHAAIERHGAVSLHNWHFDRVREQGGRRTRERCVGVDFRKARCRLMAVDGTPPDEAALAEYERDVPQPVRADLPNMDLRNWIAIDTLAPGESGERAMEVRFNMASRSQDEYEQSGRATGSGTIDRDEGAFTALRTSNTVAFRPSFGVRIDTLNVDIEFVIVDDEVFASRLHLHARGRAFGFKSIEEDTRVRFDNFARR